MEHKNELKVLLKKLNSRSIEEYLYTAYEPADINDWYVMLTVPESTVFRETVYIGKVLFWLGLYEVGSVSEKALRAKEKVEGAGYHLDRKSVV